MNKRGGISIHAVDVSTGRPAHGLQVRLRLLGSPEAVFLAQGACGPTGALDHPVTKGVGVETGDYEAEFDIGPYYRAAGIDLPKPAFLETVVYRFGIAEVSEHFHLPLKFTPWGFSLFRGGL
jgi:5-hydroxyisourate hydrolase-like protein (transthyretin family)